MVNGKIKVLIVDDSVLFREVLARGLSEDPEIKIVGKASNPFQARDMIIKYSPDCLTCDIQMPRMNGIGFLKVAKQDPAIKRIPVIVLTTSRDERDRVESFNLGIAGYMLKPVDYLQFVEVVRAIDMYWTLSELPD